MGEGGAVPIVVERGGCPLHGWLRGPEGAPLVLFLHGAGLDHRMFDAQVDQFAATYRTLALDLRGHGRSRPLGDRFSLRDLADDVVAFLDHLAAPQVWLVGQSLGGNVAQEVVFRFPGRVAGLAVLGAACNTLPLSAVESLALRVSLPLLALYPDRALKRAIVQRVSRRPEVRAYAAGAVAAVPRRDFLRIWGELTRGLHHEPGYRIDRPLLLLLGDDDRLGNFRRAYPIWARRDTGGRFTVIPQAGHNANQDNPDAFNRALGAFLAEAGAAGG